MSQSGEAAGSGEVGRAPPGVDAVLRRPQPLAAGPVSRRRAGRAATGSASLRSFGPPRGEAPRRPPHPSRVQCIGAAASFSVQMPTRLQLSDPSPNVCAMRRRVEWRSEYPTGGFCGQLLNKGLNDLATADVLGQLHDTVKTSSRTRWSRIRSGKEPSKK